MKHRLAAVLCAITFAGSGLADEAPGGFDQAASTALATYPSAGLAVVRIEDGEIAWSGFAGEQAPDVPVSASTLFNTASIAKTVTAELILRLVSDGKIALDEPISSEYVHPDLADDPRHELLTPAILLAHLSGLKNWPYSYEDGHLAFVQDPGVGFTYSGIGFEMLAEFASRRMDTPFAELVLERVVRPAGIEGDLFLGAATAPPARRVMPMLRDGTYAEVTDFEMPPSAADNLYVTAPAYARLLINMMRETDLGGDLAEARSAAVFDSSDFAECTLEETGTCPSETSQSLGWSVAQIGSSRYVFHAGQDRGENALVIYDVATDNGWVIFVNGGNGMGVWLQVMETLAPEDAYFNFVRSLPQVRAMLDALKSK